jgi:hypothetical protein
VIGAQISDVKITVLKQLQTDEIFRQYAAAELNK